jgi:uncharacterized metal-binding protein YceD (DUF177 family)
MFHNIQLNELPPEGKDFAGEIRNDIFGLTGEDDPRFVPPVRFSLHLRLDGPDIVVEGSIHGRFELRCARCGQWFPWEVALDHYYTREPREGASTLDLTGQIREDILLALPGYPRCEESNVETRTCPAKGRFAAESEFTPLEEADARESRRRDVWDVLDRIQPPPGKPRRPKS